MVLIKIFDGTYGVYYTIFIINSGIYCYFYIIFIAFHVNIVNYIYSKIDKDREEQYLKTTLSLNPMFVKGWLNLAKLKFDNNLPELAQKYLYPVKLIAPDNEDYKQFLNTFNENSNINKL